MNALISSLRARKRVTLLFRAHFERGLLQTLYCFAGSTIGGARSCRSCECRYTCKDYLFRLTLWKISGSCIFDALMKLDVGDE